MSGIDSSICSCAYCGILALGPLGQLMGAMLIYMVSIDCWGRYRCAAAAAAGTWC